MPRFCAWRNRVSSMAISGASRTAATAASARSLRSNHSAVRPPPWLKPNSTTSAAPWVSAVVDRGVEVRPLRLAEVAVAVLGRWPHPVVAVGDHERREAHVVCHLHRPQRLGALRPAPVVEHRPRVILTRDEPRRAGPRADTGRRPPRRRGAPHTRIRGEGVRRDVEAGSGLRSGPLEHLVGAGDGGVVALDDGADLREAVGVVEPEHAVGGGVALGGEADQVTGHALYRTVVVGRLARDRRRDQLVGVVPAARDQPQCDEQHDRRDRPDHDAGGSARHGSLDPWQVGGTNLAGGWDQPGGGWTTWAVGLRSSR